MKCLITDCPDYTEVYPNHCRALDNIKRCSENMDKAQKPEAVKSKSNDGLDGVLAEAKRGFVDAKQMRKQFKESGHVNKEEFWRGEAMGFFKIITFIEKAI